MTARSHGKAHARWTERLERFDQSDLSVSRFCEQERCSPASFYQWRRKLRSETSWRQSTESTFVPVKIATAANPSLSAHATVSLDLPGGIRLRIEVPAECSPTGEQEAVR